VPPCRRTTVRRTTVSGFAALAVCSLFAACSGGSGTTAGLLPQATAPRIESASTPGDAEALAGELLVAAGRTQQPPLRPPFQLSDQALAGAIATIAMDHLRSVGLGAGTGPDAIGSRRIGRLAAATNAPGDLNGSGSNRDETVAADVARLAAAAGAAVPAGLLQLVLPWHEASARLAAAAPRPDAPAGWRASTGPSRTVRLADVAAAMQGRVRAISNLIAQQRGTLVGATPDDGLLGLLLLAEVVGAEEELVGALSTDGSLLGGFVGPHGYDPAAGRRWFAAEVDVPSDQVPWHYRARDLASDLEGLAALLDTAAELAWFAGPTNPSQAVRAVFTGPFAPPPPQNPQPPRLNWDQNIQPIVGFNCSGCHLGFPTGGFLIDTYQSFLQGSPRTRTFGPFVIPGDHLNSFLHRILTNPPPPVLRMPPTINPLPSAQLQTIDTWIDQGALEHPETPPPPPAFGEDLAKVCFRNLVAMHLDRTTGALHNRHEGDRASGIATATATGRALSALAHLREVLPDLEQDGLDVADVLAMTASYAAMRFVGPGNRVFDQVAIAAGTATQPAELDAQAVLTTGLLDAARSPGITLAVQTAAIQAGQTLLLSFRDPVESWFRTDPDHAFARYSTRTLADLVAALRVAGSAGGVGPLANDALRQLLARLLPAMANASWSGVGELPDPDAAGLLPVLAGSILVGPADDPPPADQPVTWSQHVRPLLVNKCFDCHLGGTSQGGYRIDTLALLATPGGQNSPAPTPMLVPGNADASFFYHKLVDRVPAVGAQMPFQRSLLDDRARANVRQWIDAGATAR